jgi:Alpha/beta hydrolase domain containing 18
VNILWPVNGEVRRVIVVGDTDIHIM